MKKLLLILILVLLGVQTVSGWWFDDFTSDTSADYTGTNFAANFYWNTAKSNLSAGPYTGAYESHQIYYNGEQYIKGNFTYKFAVNTSGATTYRPSVNFGAADVYTATEIYGQSSCKGTETKYTSYLMGDLGGNPRYYLTQCIGGAPTDLDTADLDASWIRDDTSIFYFIVNWDPAGLPSPQFPPGDTINITLWKKGSGDMNYLSSNDATITTGYSGMGSKYWQVFYSWDWINFHDLAGPPSPPPISLPDKYCVYNDNITISKGETWIRWNWSMQENISTFILDDQDVYLNGSLWRQNYTHNYFNLPGIGSNSYQVLEVWQKNYTYDNITQCMYSAVRSDPAAVWWYLIIGLGLLCIGYFVPLFGFLAIIILLLGFYMVYQEYTQSYIVLTYALSTIITMIVTAFRIGGGMKK